MLYKIIVSDLNKNDLEQFILNNSITMIIDGDWTFNYYQNILESLLFRQHYQYLYDYQTDHYLI